MSKDALDPAALTLLIGDILPSANRKLASPQDALSALVHAIFSSLAFRLIAVDDNSAASNYPDNVLPEDWNTHNLVDRTFRYKHEQSSLEFVVKVIKLGQRTLINAIAVEDDKAASLDISTNDFVSPSFYPYDFTAPNAGPIVHGFISSNRIMDLTSQLKLKVFSKIMPGLRKEGYTEETAELSSATASTPSAGNRQPARPRPQAPPNAPDDDPYRVPLRFPSRNPLEIGRRDLDPFPANPFAPPSLFPPGGSDGMFVGPQHPIFGVRGRGVDERGLWGGDGFLPPMGAPPGARFDPIGPGIGPFPPGGPGGRPRGGPPGNSHEPDNDEFMPPGAGDMFM